MAEARRRGREIEWDVPAIQRLARQIGHGRVWRHRPHFIYRAFDAEGNLLYIGRTWKPWVRMDAHRRTSPWFPLAARVDWEFVGGYEDAKRVEARAILHEHPIYNRQYTVGDQAGRVAAYEAKAEVAA